MSDDPDPCSSSDIARISVAVTMLDPDWPRAVPAVEDLARRAAEAAATVSGPAAKALAARGAEISLVLTDDATLRRYNRDYRGIDKPTNVLAFAAVVAPGWEPGGAPGEAEGPLLLGDVLLARETLAREAEAQGKRPADHLCHLVVHGVLHLLGQDHQAESEAQVMERLEVAALGRLGVADPYAAAGASPGASPGASAGVSAEVSKVSG
jgi:probable rRNA maturation factor